MTILSWLFYDWYILSFIVVICYENVIINMDSRLQRSTLYVTNLCSFATVKTLVYYGNKSEI